MRKLKRVTVIIMEYYRIPLELINNPNTNTLFGNKLFGSPLYGRNVLFKSMPFGYGRLNTVSSFVVLAP